MGLPPLFFPPLFPPVCPPFSPLFPPLDPPLYLPFPSACFLLGSQTCFDLAGARGRVALGRPLDFGWHDLWAITSAAGSVRDAASRAMVSSRETSMLAGGPPAEALAPLRASGSLSSLAIVCPPNLMRLGRASEVEQALRKAGRSKLAGVGWSLTKGTRPRPEATGGAATASATTTSVEAGIARNFKKIERW